MIFITGCSGFIGGSLAYFLSRKGIEIRELGRENFNYDEYKNLNDNILVHCAWSGVLGKDRNDKIQAENINLTKRLLNLINYLNINKVIAFGSQAEYGPINKRVSEIDVCSPSTNYGKTKLECMELFKDNLCASEKEFIWLRLFDTYGPKDNPAWFIPYVIRSALKNESTKLTECSQVWDYIYILDLCHCIEKIIFNQKINSGIYNLSSDKQITLKSIVELIYNQVNPPNAIPLYGKIPFRNDQVFHLQGNNEKITSTFKWSPHTDIVKGITKTISYEKSLSS